MPNDINLEFYFFPMEIYKSEEDIKAAYFNSSGSVIAIVTKSGIIKLYDFIGKMVIFTITYFKDNEKQSKHIFNHSHSPYLVRGFGEYLYYV
jgi:hypothetical protein